MSMRSRDRTGRAGVRDGPLPLGLRRPQPDTRAGEPRRSPRDHRSRHPTRPDRRRGGLRSLAAGAGSCRRRHSPPPWKTARRADDAVGDEPLAVLDARGEGLATLVFTGGALAVICRAAVDGAGAVSRRGPGDRRGGEGWPAAPGPDAGHPRPGGPARAARVPARSSWGRWGDGVHSVAVNFDDATWSTAAKANGWYAIWWPGTEKALGCGRVRHQEHRHRQRYAPVATAGRAPAGGYPVETGFRSSAAISCAQASISGHGR